MKKLKKLSDHLNEMSKADSMNINNLEKRIDAYLKRSISSLDFELLSDLIFNNYDGDEYIDLKGNTKYLVTSIRYDRKEQIYDGEETVVVKCDDRNVAVFVHFIYFDADIEDGEYEKFDEDFDYEDYMFETDPDKKIVVVRI